MLLSDAILQGIEGTTQADGSYFEMNAEGQLSCCVLGAACRATGLQPDFYDDVEIIEEHLAINFPDVYVVEIEAPSERYEGSLADIMVTLNYDWSREDIAAWLKTIGR